MPSAGPRAYLPFSLCVQMGNLAAQWDIAANYQITTFFFLFAPFTRFLAVWVEGKVGLRDRLQFGMICPHPPLTM